MSSRLWLCPGEAESNGALLDGLMRAATANLVRRVRGKVLGAGCSRGLLMGGAGPVVEAGLDGDAHAVEPGQGEG